MKKIVALTILASFILLPATVLAQQKERGGTIPHINCCFQDGQCLRTHKRNCAMKKGIVVPDCRECPGVWGKGKKSE